jgi:hypothetical protein
MELYQYFTFVALGLLTVLQVSSSFELGNSCLRGEILVQGLCEQIDVGFVTETDNAQFYRRCEKSMFSGTAFCDAGKWSH